jgi:hypothetical protein
LYAVLGGFLFFMPEQLSPVFAWKVTPFMTMTIGGWCLGNAWLAFVIARRWEWSTTYAGLVYFGLFGIGELLVMYFFRTKLALAHWIAWLYLVTILVNSATALFLLVDFFRTRPRVEPAANRSTPSQYLAAIGFILFVGFLGYWGLTAQIGDPGTNGGIFPEVMSLFTLRSFGVFYLTLAIPVFFMLWDRNRRMLLTHGFIHYGLILFITAAAFAYLPLFDFTNRPGGLAYFGAYFFAGIAFLINFIKYGFGDR